jgi:predicted phosphoribosyltransferase
VLISTFAPVWYLNVMILKQFVNRTQAGSALVEELRKRSWSGRLVVVGLPRGGVPVAAEVARELHAPLDIMMVRKIGTPGHEELACGAIATPDVVVWNERVLAASGQTLESLAAVLEREREEMLRRERAIRSFLTPALSLEDAAVVLVDDGVATGATMKAAIKAARLQRPREILVALPVAPTDTYGELRRENGCEVVCLAVVPAGAFGSVGSWYEDFSQVETEACRDLLEENRRSVEKQSYPAPGGDSASSCHSV